MDGSSDAPLAQVRDSAGIAIVHNLAPDPEDRLGWTIDEVPILTIGESPGEELFRVVAALRLGDGRVLVANAGTSEIKVFDPSGSLQATWGREGDGPGEFSSLSHIARLTGDSILAWDQQGHRITVFDPQGDLVRTASALDVGRIQPAAVLPDGSILVGSSPLSRPGDIEPGRVSRDREITLLDPVGRPLTRFGEHPWDEFYPSELGEMRAMFPHPFGRGTVGGSWGDRVVLGLNYTFEVRAYDRTGRLELIVRREHQAPPVTQADVDRWIENRLSGADEVQRQTLGAVFAGIPAGETYPAYDEILSDQARFLWVREPTLPVEDRLVWNVFDREGRLVGLFETPSGAAVLEIGVDHLLTVATDELDVERVQMWALRRDGT